MLLAILRQWKVILQIGRIVLIIEIVFGLIVFVIATVTITTYEFDNKSDRNTAIVLQTIQSIDILCDIILSMLIGKYNDELKNASSA